MACGFAANVVVVVVVDVAFLSEANSDFTAGFILHDLLLIIALSMEE